MNTQRIIFAAALLSLPMVMRAVRNKRKTAGASLPPPGPQKQDPERLDEILDEGVEASMDASDPVSTVQPDVKVRH
jgi:hypothetical protein